MMMKVIRLLFLSMFLTALSSCELALIPEEDEIPNIDTIDQNTLIDTNYERLFTPFTYKKLTISLTQTKANELNDLMLAHYDAFQDYRSDDYVTSSIRYEDALGQIEALNIGFRTRGNTFSRQRFLNEDNALNVNHYKLKFNAFNESSSPTLFGLEELDLKYNKNQDPTYMNEYYALRMYEQIGVLTQKVILMDVFIEIDNQSYHMGVYSAFEPVDQYFIARRFIGEEIGDLYKVLWQQFGPATLSKPSDMNAIGIKNASQNYRPTYDLKTNKTTSNHEALLTVMDVLSQSFSIRTELLKTHYDLDMFAKYFAVSFLLGNPDDFRYNGNNVYLYFTPDQRMYIIPYDLDHSLGSGWDGSPVFSDQLRYTLPLDDTNFLDYVFNTDYAHPLIDTLFNMPEFIDVYKNYIVTILNDPILYTFSDIQYHIDRYQSVFGEVVIDSFVHVAFGYRDIEDYITKKIDFIRVNLA